MDEKKAEMKGVPIWEKYLLTTKEAGMYFNIGEKKMRMFAEEYLGDISLQNGRHYLIKRKKFEEFLAKTLDCYISVCKNSISMVEWELA